MDAEREGRDRHGVLGGQHGFLDQWGRACRHLAPLAAASGDGGRLYHSSHALLLAHEDKTYPGAMIASLSIPWGATISCGRGTW